MKQTISVFKVLFSNWRRAKSQLFFTIFGISVACALWSSVDAINNQTLRAQQQALQLFNTVNKPVIVKKNSSLIDETYYVKLRLGGWLVSPVIKKVYPESDIEVVGIDFLSEYKQLLNTNKIEVNIDYFSLLNSDIPTFIASAKTEKLITNKSIPLNIIINEKVPFGKIIGDISSAQKLFNIAGRFSYLEVNGLNLGSKNNLPSNDIMIIDSNAAREFRTISDSFNLNLKAFGFLSFCVGMFIVFTMIKMAFNQRIACIRSLKIIGISSKQINGCLLIELLIIALISGLIGTIVGFFVAEQLLPSVNQTINSLFDSPTKRKLEFSPYWVFLSILIAVFGTLAASFTSVLKLQNIGPIDTGKISRKKSNGLMLSYLLISLPVLFGLVFYFAHTTENLIFSFVYLAIILLIGCIFLPCVLMLLYFALKELVPVNKPLYNWFLGDTKKYASLIFSGYIAFFLALSINIGVHGMVTSFKATFMDWLDQRIFADIYVQITDNENLSTIESMADRYDAKIYPIIREQGQIGGVKLEIFGFEPSIDYEKNWPLKSWNDATWDNIRKEGYVFINEQLSRREKLNVGDLMVFLVNGKEVEQEVSAIYPDYGNSKNQIMLSLQSFSSFFPSRIPNTLAIKLDTKNYQPFVDKIIDNENISRGTIIDKTEVKELSVKIFDNTFKISFQLALVTLLVASFTLYTNLIMVRKLRRQDLLPLSAIGIPLINLLKLDVVKNIVLTLLVSVFSVFMGLTISYILSSVINPNAFGWEVPLKIFPLYWIKITIVALIIATAASSLSLRLELKKKSAFYEPF